MNKELLIEKIYNYLEKVYYEVDVIETDSDRMCLKFTCNGDIDKLINFINALNEYNFKTIDDVCDFLDWGYCYDDEVYYCGLCEKYHFIDDEGYYIICDERYCVECVEENIGNFIDEFVNNYEIALFNEVPELEKLGFKKANDEFDGSYLRGGKVDNPKDVLDELLVKYDYNIEVIFYLTYSTPFDCNYSYYYRIK